MGKPKAKSDKAKADEAEMLRQTAASERVALYINIVVAIVLISTLVYAVLDSK